jgi:hypothetical protein
MNHVTDTKLVNIIMSTTTAILMYIENPAYELSCPISHVPGTDSIAYSTIRSSDSCWHYD